ncbi:hypothetical protein K438DRAFT_1788453 [Mycena galopus ATCC 62051]|nr:hypothetical protein K438DRAFT_1788453 [Mycena galopus ATCC 62051]
MPSISTCASAENTVAISNSVLSKFQRHNPQAAFGKLIYCIARDEGRYKGEDKWWWWWGWKKMAVNTSTLRVGGVLNEVSTPYMAFVPERGVDYILQAQEAETRGDGGEVETRGNRGEAETGGNRGEAETRGDVGETKIHRSS